MPTEMWTDIKNAILSSIKGQAADFLDKNKDIEKIISERAERLAKLTYLYSVAADGPGKDQALDQMRTVQQTLDNELTAALLNAQGSGGELLKKIASMAFDLILKAVPAILAKI